MGFKQQLLGGLTTQSLVNSCSIPALSQSHLPLQRLQKQGQACGAAAVQQHRFQDFAPGIKRNMGRSPAQKNNMCIYMYLYSKTCHAYSIQSCMFTSQVVFTYKMQTPMMWSFSDHPRIWGSLSFPRPAQVKVNGACCMCA